LLGKGAKNTSTEYVSLFQTVPKMLTHSVDTRLRAMFWFRASLALFSVLSTRCPLNRKIVQIVATGEVASDLREFPLFRAGVIDPATKKVELWWIWDGEKEWQIGSLTEEQRKFPIRGVWNDTYLIEKIESGWTPEADQF
jgi:hypothetical protein